ncbi:MAG: alpha/beta hydrolase [Desulfobacterales bacterium]|nr:alpha/beta hydrolase [Desulfobacterales bacterium]
MKKTIPDYIEAGQGKPIVFIPGMEGVKTFWHYQMEPFSKKYRFITCDLVIKQPQLSRRVSEYAEDVLRLLDHLKLNQVILVGESFGGMIAQELSIYHKDRISALVLCNTTTQFHKGNFGMNMFTLATLIHPTAFMFPKIIAKQILRWTSQYRGFVLDTSKGNDELIDYILEYGLNAGLAGYLDRLIASLKENYTSKLNEIDVPTLIIRGTEDQLVSSDIVLQFVGRIPFSKLVLIDGGGHCCSYTMPDETNRAILNWLASLPL